MYWNERRFVICARFLWRIVRKTVLIIKGRYSYNSKYREILWEKNVRNDPWKYNDWKVVHRVSEYMCVVFLFIG